MSAVGALLVLCVVSSSARADDTLDFLLKSAATQPATRPSALAPAPALASQPAAPFGEKPNPEARKGTITLSTGRTLTGQIATTREKPLRIWDAKDKQYRDVPLTLVKSMEAQVLWEREEKEWHFKESGSDIKEYTGKSYPARELVYKVTLLNDQTITGGIVAPLYISIGDKQQLYVLNKRQKGETGQTLKDLLYIKKVELE